LLACGTDPKPEPEAIYPADYATTYREVRNCRQSIDHDIMFVRILAAPEAFEAYDGRLKPFVAGDLIVKEQYDEDDPNCEGPIASITAMRKLDEGAAPDEGDWEWQKTDANGKTDTEYNLARCSGCHVGPDGCGQPPYGYLGTCAGE
jgi:hypothetical protein